MRTRSVAVALLLSVAWLWLFTPQPASHARLIEPPSPARPAAAFTPSPIVADLIAQVQATRLYSDLAQLSGETSVIVGGQTYTFTTRNTRSGTPIQKATQYVYERFQTLGLSAKYHDWTACSATSRNVIGTITGTVVPNEIVLITAHLDDMPSSGRAPGADDNGSGSIGVLTAAELLRTQRFDRTLRFVLFTGEEQGLCGSNAYAAAVYAAGDNIVAVYNMDMIAWDSTGAPTLRLHTRTTGNAGYPADLAIAGVFTNVVSAYGLSGGLTPIVTADGESASDHSEFWAKGYPAILAIEDDYNDFNSYYHTINDNLSHINLTYFTNFVKASVGTAAHLARPSAAIIAGLVSNVQTGSPIVGAQIWVTSTTLLTNTLSGADGRYRVTLLDGDYQLSATAAGFRSKTYNSVIAQAGLTTTRNFSLTPIPTYTVTGVISDAVTGWPLSATITITGHAHSPIDVPGETGYYHVTLMEGGPYTLHVKANLPAYPEAMRVIESLTADRVEDFPLLSEVEPHYVSYLPIITAP